MSEMHLVKRKGHFEKFDDRKIYASCYAACLGSHVEKEKAENISDKVTKEINLWIKGKKNVTSNEIFKQVTMELKKHDSDTAFMFETHRDIS